MDRKACIPCVLCDFTTHTKAFLEEHIVQNHHSDLPPAVLLVISKSVRERHIRQEENEAASAQVLNFNLSNIKKEPVDEWSNSIPSHERAKSDSGVKSSDSPVKGNTWNADVTAPTRHEAFYHDKVKEEVDVQDYRPCSEELVHPAASELDCESNPRQSEGQHRPYPVISRMVPFSAAERGDGNDNRVNMWGGLPTASFPNPVPLLCVKNEAMNPFHNNSDETDADADADASPLPRSEAQAPTTLAEKITESESWIKKEPPSYEEEAECDESNIDVSDVSTYTDINTGCMAVMAMEKDVDSRLVDSHYGGDVKQEVVSESFLDSTDNGCAPDSSNATPVTDVNSVQEKMFENPCGENLMGDMDGPSQKLGLTSRKSKQAHAQTIDSGTEGCQDLHLCLICHYAFLTEFSLKTHLESCTAGNKKIVKNQTAPNDCGKNTDLEAPLHCSLNTADSSPSDMNQVSHVTSSDTVALDYDSKKEIFHRKFKKETTSMEIPYYHCVECGMSFHRFQLFHKHRKEHAMKRQGYLYCGECGKRFRKKICLAFHMKTHLNDKSPPPKRTYKTDNKMEQPHAQVPHEFEGVLHGADPNAFTKRPDSSRLFHQIIKNSREKQFEDNKGGEGCDQNETEPKPENSTAGDKSYNCRVCGQRFFSVSKLKTHKEGHEASFECVECGNKFVTREGLEKHLRIIHSRRRLFKCDKCPKKFKYTAHLTMHKRGHLGQKLYHCKKCDKKFTWHYGLRCHMRLHSGQALHECSKCHKKFIWHYQLKAHLISHSDARPFQCSVCQAFFKSSSYLLIHKRKHKGEKPYKCEICNKAFGWQSGYNDHKKQMHLGIEFECAQCGEKFANRYRRDVHMRTHSGGNRFYCTECEKCFAEEHRLKRHMRVHTGETPYKCEDCGKSFRWTKRLHSCLGSSSVSFECQICGRGFRWRVSLINHMLIHSGKKPFTCQDCGASFRLKRSLQKHMISLHPGRKPFKCNECGKAFHRKVSLHVHQKVHVLEKPFKCSQCHMSFHQKVNLDTHSKLAHD